MNEEATNPTEGVEEFDERSIEDKLAAAFERAEKAPKAEAQEEETAEEPAEETAEESAEPSDESEDVEYEGKAYRLPKELKEALLRQQDYTKKAQDVAETRRVLEQQRAQVELQSKFQEKHLEKLSEAQYLSRQLQQFSQVDWAKLADENPAQYLQLDRQQRTLQDAYNRSVAEIQSLSGEFEKEVRSTKQKAQAQCLEELKRHFDPNPETIKALDETGKSFGFTGEELAQVTDPRMIRVLHAAMQYKKLQSSKSLVDKKVATAKPVQLASARSTPSTQANASLADAKQRALKSGNTKDVESFLEKRFAKSMR